MGAWIRWGILACFPFGALRLQERVRFVVPLNFHQPASADQLTHVFWGEQGGLLLTSRPGGRVVGWPRRPGHDVVERKEAAGLEDPRYLLIEPDLVADVHGRVLRPYDIEAVVAKWQARGIAAARQNRSLHADCLRESRRVDTKALRQVEGDDRDFVVLNKLAGRTADARPDIQHEIASARVSQLRKMRRAAGPTHMQLIKSGKIRRAQGALDFAPVRAHQLQNSLTERAFAAIVGSNLVALRHCCLPVAAAAADDHDEKAEDQIDGHDLADDGQLGPGFLKIATIDRLLEAAPGGEEEVGEDQHHKQSARLHDVHVHSGASKASQWTENHPVAAN